MANKYLSDKHKADLVADKLDKKMKKEIVPAEKKEVIVDKNYPHIKYEGKARYIPSQTKRLQGCINCEWRGTQMCPFGFKRGSGIKLRKNIHDNGICKMRENYLLGFYRGEKEKPSFTEWVMDYNQGIAQMQLQEDFKKLKEYEIEISKLTDKEEKEDMATAMMNHREGWFKLWKSLMDFDDKRVERETPKKIEVKHESMSLSDIHRVMKESSVEADFKVVENKDENPNV